MRDVASVESLSQCAEKCGREDYCNSFSYRFSQYNDQDNCLLSILNTGKILQQSDLVADQDWDIFQQKCKDNFNADWTIREKSSKLSGSAVDITSAVSSVKACGDRCKSSVHCKTFAFSSQGYTNCQLSRLSFDNLGGYDLVKDTKWDVYQVKRTGSNEGSIYFPTRPTTTLPPSSTESNFRIETNQLLHMLL